MTWKMSNLPGVLGLRELPLGVRGEAGGKASARTSIFEPDDAIIGTLVGDGDMISDPGERSSSKR